MARRKSLTGQLYRIARDSANVRAARGGPASYGKRVVRRKVYAKSNGLTGRLLRRLLK
jgi:hypothetical protein